MGLLDRLADRTHQAPDAGKKKLQEIKKTADEERKIRKDRDYFWSHQGDE